MIKNLRVLAILEGISYLLLGVTMPLKYMLEMHVGVFVPENTLPESKHVIDSLLLKYVSILTPIDGEISIGSTVELGNICSATYTIYL